MEVIFIFFFFLLLVEGINKNTCKGLLQNKAVEAAEETVLLMKCVYLLVKMRYGCICQVINKGLEICLISKSMTSY